MLTKNSTAAMHYCHLLIKKASFEKTTRIYFLNSIFCLQFRSSTGGQLYNALQLDEGT